MAIEPANNPHTGHTPVQQRNSQGARGNQTRRATRARADSIRKQSRIKETGRTETRNHDVRLTRRNEAAERVRNADTKQTQRNQTDRRRRPNPGDQINVVA